MRGSKPYRLFWALRWQEGRVVPFAALIDVLWGDDPMGGPSDPINNITVYACRLRQKHRARWRLTTIYGHGLMIERR